jgi:hypothetical protein
LSRRKVPLEFVAPERVILTKTKSCWSAAANESPRSKTSNAPDAAAAEIDTEVTLVQAVGVEPEEFAEYEISIPEYPMSPLPLLLRAAAKERDKSDSPDIDSLNTIDLPFCVPLAMPNADGDAVEVAKLVPAVLRLVPEYPLRAVHVPEP